MQNIDDWIDKEVIVERSGSDARGRLIALLSRGLMLDDGNGMTYVPWTSV
jgi:hypothetical protein